jgi:hypothetical protein
MFRKVASFAQRTPERASKVIVALAIALIVVMIGALVAIVDIEDLFEPPYPSETTPLGWNGGAVVWTSADTVIFTGGGGYVVSTGGTNPSDLYAEYDDGWGRNYNNMRFSWGHDSSTLGGHLVNDSDQQSLRLGVEATVESFAGGTFADGQWINYSLVITDLLGNGAFDQGDQVTFKTSPGIGASIYEDQVSTIALVYVGSQTYRVGEFSFGFHDGEFFAWKSNELIWDQPWWE